jgi:hypothetical protein
LAAKENAVIEELNSARAGWQGHRRWRGHRDR